MASIAELLLTDRPTPTPTLDLPRPHFGPTGANRRFVPRRNARFIVRLRGESRSYEGVDISFAGMMCTGEAPTWPGNLLDLDLILPGDHQPVTVRGRVVELVPCRGRVAMRVRFEAMSHDERKRIAQWMARSAS